MTDLSAKVPPGMRYDKKNFESRAVLILNIQDKSMMDKWGLEGMESFAGRQ